MANPSTIPPASRRDVAVVGRGRGLDAVARTLRSKHFAVTRVVEADRRSVFRYVVVVGEAGMLRDWQWTSTEGGLLALIGGHKKMESLVRTRLRDDHWDFVRVMGAMEREEPDDAAMSEIVARVRRLCAAARPTAGAVAGDLMSQLRDPATGRVDAQRVAEFAGVSLKELSAAIGQKYTTVHKTPVGKGLQESLGPIVRSVELLLGLGKSPEQVRAWLHAPHGELDERTPWSVMAMGRADVVRDMLLGASIGLPT